MFNQVNRNSKLAVAALSLLTVLFWAGTSQAGQAATANQLTNDEVKALTTNARTAADHERLAQHFTANALASEAEAKVHEDMATQYRQTPNPDETKRPGSPRTYAHCYKTAAGLHRDAESARQLAIDHTAMTKNTPN